MTRASGLFFPIKWDCPTTSLNAVGRILSAKGILQSHYASVLGLDMGMFYKRRDYSTIVNGRNPIIAHEYLGTSVKGNITAQSSDSR